MSNFTPGPWEVVNERPLGIRSTVATPGSGFIARLYVGGRSAPNAKLIAAAPDLAAVLLRYVELEESSAPYSSSPMREAARAALAKAGIA